MSRDIYGAFKMYSIYPSLQRRCTPWPSSSYHWSNICYFVVEIQRSVPAFECHFSRHRLFIFAHLNLPPKPGIFQLVVNNKLFSFLRPILFAEYCSRLFQPFVVSVLLPVKLLGTYVPGDGSRTRNEPYRLGDTEKGSTCQNEQFTSQWIPHCRQTQAGRNYHPALK